MSNGQKKRFSRWRPPHSWILKISIFWSRDCHRVECSVPSFIQIGRLITEIWRFNDFQNGSRPPSWILKIKNLQFLSCSPCRHDVLLPHTKFCWNRTISQWIMAKKAIFKMAAVAISNFNFWSHDRNRVKYLLLFTKFHQNRKIFHWDWRYYDFQNGGRPPSWILKICSFCHMAFVDMPFCFLTQYFAEILRWQSPPSWIINILIFEFTLWDAAPPRCP